MIEQAFAPAAKAVSSGRIPGATLGVVAADGRRWVRGGSWVHNGLGPAPRIGLVSMGGAGDFTALFDHVRVWALAP